MTLHQILTAAGWQTGKGIDQAIYTGLPIGIILRTPVERPTVQTLGDWLVASGLKAQGEIVNGLAGIEIIVGANI